MKTCFSELYSKWRFGILKYWPSKVKIFPLRPACACYHYCQTEAMTDQQWVESPPNQISYKLRYFVWSWRTILENIESISAVSTSLKSNLWNTNGPIIAGCRPPLFSPRPANPSKPGEYEWLEEHSGLFDIILENNSLEWSSGLRAATRTEWLIKPNCFQVISDNSSGRKGGL